MQYSPSRDWNANPMDCPLSRYSQHFKDLVDKLTREAAAAKGHDLQATCPICGRQGTIAIGKKIGQIGNIYLNCKFCREWFDICCLDMPPAMILQIEDERAKEVKDWNQREGVEAYLESTKDKGKGKGKAKAKAKGKGKSFTPVPATPSAKSSPLTLDEELALLVADKAPRTPSPRFSPLPPSSIPSTQRRSRIPPVHFGTQHSGTAESPLTLLSPFITPEHKSSGSGSGSARKRCLIEDPEEKANAKKPRVDVLQQLDIFFWFKDGLNYIHSEEIVGKAFSISEFVTLREAMRLSMFEEFQVWYPNACEWCKAVSMETPIANYPDDLGVIIVRVDGVKECPGFHQVVGKIFKDF